MNLVKRVAAFSVIVVAFLLFINYSAKPSTNNNLYLNGGFEQSHSGLPSAWVTNLYSTDGSNSKFYIDRQAPHSGKNCFTIESKTANDAKLIQTINVKSNTVYKLSCYIRAEDVPKGKMGAYISVIDIVDASANVYNTSGKWQYVELYGKTGNGQKTLDVCLRLGGYGSINTGKASFDDFSVEEVQNPPSNIKVVSFFESITQTVSRKAEFTAKTICIALFIIIYLALFAVCMQAVKHKDKLKVYINKKGILIFLIIVICAFILRIILAVKTEGYQSDINCFESWGALSAQSGLAKFYTSTSFIDYPPAYIYILYLIGKIQILFKIGAGSSYMLTLIKLPAIIADVICSVMIFKVASKKTDKITALVLCILYCFNPAVIFNSSIWGQIDGLLSLLIFLIVLLIMDENLILASFVFTVAVLLKPQALIFSPLLIYAFLSKRNLKLFVRSALISIGAFIILILPFSLNQKFCWIFAKYYSTLSSYPYGSVNAFNLFSLMGKNLVSDKTTLYFIPLKYWGSIFLVLIVAFSLLVFIRSKRPWKLTYIAFFIITGVFVLTTKMHERYMFPAIILALLWYIYSLDKRALYLFAGVSITQFLNMAYVYLSTEKGNSGISNTAPVLTITSLINVLLVIYVIKIGVDYCKAILIKPTDETKTKMTKNNTEPLKLLKILEKRIF